MTAINTGPLVHKNCGGIIGWDADVDSNGEVYGPYDSSRCLDCGADNPEIEEAKR